jgi:Glycosyltransferase like family
LIAYGAAVTDEATYERYALAGIRSVAEPGSAIMRRDGMPLQSAYNEMLDEVSAEPELEAVVLPHQDLRIEEPDFNHKLRAVLEDPSVALVGAVGGRGVRSLAWDDDAEMVGTMGGWVHGDVTSFRSEGFAGVVDVDVLDGTLLIFSSWAARNLRFDVRFERDFHAYDADICFQALAAGRRVVVADLWSVHCGFGAIAHRRGSWVRASLEFDRKWRTNWPARCKPSASARSMVTRQRLSIHDQIEWELRAALAARS